MSDGALSQQEIEVLISGVDTDNDVNFTIVKEPPLGLKPRWIVEEYRVQEICEAVMRYKKAGEPVPEAWIDELSELVEK
jgi:hypothetical protein